MAQKQFKIGLSNVDKQNMAQDVYERLLALTFPEYDTTTQYEVGDFVVYNDQLYKCISATSGAWDSSKWQLATLNDLVADIEGAVAFVNDKANVNGNYPTMTVGNADQLNSTVYVVDKVPYLYRTSGGDADIGNREYDKIIGGSLAVNQLVPTPIGDLSISGSLTFTKNDAGDTIIINGTANALSYCHFTLNNSLVNGHKILLCANATLPDNSWFGIMSDDYVYSSLNAVALNEKCKVITVPNDNKNYNKLIIWSANATFDNVNLKPKLIDLTVMFGSIIADYIYSLEQANEGAGVAWFRNYFKEEYYPFNSGAIKNVKLVSHDMVGFNQWDGENDIKAFANTTYYIYGSATLTYKDHEGNTISSESKSNETFTTPANCEFVEVNGTGDICINLSWSGWRNGQYEPYQKNSYQLDTTIELRGIPKLDSNNHLYFDGDEYSSDGKVVRKYGIVDLGTLNYTADHTSHRFYTTDLLTLIKAPSSNAEIGNVICSKYNSTYLNDIFLNNAYGVAVASTGAVSFSDIGYTDYTADQFKTAMSGVYLVYELATPIEETATPFQEPQIVDDFGTEEYVVPTQDGWQVPVGHDTKYPANLRDKLQRLPDMPSVSQNVTETYVVNYNGATKKCTFVAIDTWLGSNGYAKADTLPTKDSVGGTLRQCLCVKESLDFDNTSVVDMGDLNWYYDADLSLFRVSINEKAVGSKLISTNYKTTLNQGFSVSDKCVTGSDSSSYANVIFIKDTNYTNATTFKNAMKGVLLAYEKA